MPVASQEGTPLDAETFPSRAKIGYRRALANSTNDKEDTEPTNSLAQTACSSHRRQPEVAIGSRIDSATPSFYKPAHARAPLPSRFLIA
jgi:hypothetical protein